MDDDDSVRRGIERSLEQAGYDAGGLGAPRKALELLSRSGARVSLLITDVEMPGLTGPELAEQLATSNPEGRVLFISGYCEEQALHGHARPSVPHAFLQKPFRGSQLIDAVSRLLA